MLEGDKLDSFIINFTFSITKSGVREVKQFSKVELIDAVLIELIFT